MRDPSDMAHVGGIFKRAPLALPAVHWKERGVRPWRRVMAGEITGKPMAGYQEFQVPYRDVDLNGEMFRGAYLYHAEEALADFWRHRKPVVDDPFFVVSKLNLTFHQPLRLGEHVRMTVAVSKIGGKSAGFIVHMRRGKEDIAEAEIVWSSVDPKRESQSRCRKTCATGSTSFSTNYYARCGRSG